MSFIRAGQKMEVTHYVIDTNHKPIKPLKGKLGIVVSSRLEDNDLLVSLNIDEQTVEIPLYALKHANVED